MNHCGNFAPRALTRREMLARCAHGFGAIALTALLADKAFGEVVSTSTEPHNSLAPRLPHFPAKAKQVIFLYMDGGPSQVDTFDPKPRLTAEDGQLEQARRASAEKDQRIRILEWQLGAMSQEMQQSRLRAEVAWRELGAQIQQLHAANATLAEQVRTVEARGRAGVPFGVQDDAEPAPPGRPKPAGSRLSREDLRVVQGMIEARNAPLAETLARIEKLLQARPETPLPPLPPLPQRRPERTITGDLVDPWGFGERK